MEKDTIKDWLEKVQLDPFKLKSAPHAIRENKSVVKASLCRSFKDYISFSLDGWHVDGLFEKLAIFESVGYNLRRDKLFLREIIPLCSGFIFKYLDDDFRTDKNLFLFCLQHATEDYIYQMLNEYLEENEEEDLDFVNFDSFDYALINCELIKDTDNENNLAFLAEKNFMEKALILVPSLYSEVSESLKADKQITLIAVQGSQWNFCAIPTSLSNDIDIVMAYLDGEAGNLHFDPLYWDEIGDVLKNDINFYKEMINKWGFKNLKYIFKRAPEHILQDELIKEYLEKK
jgi:hypothetical protein